MPESTLGSPEANDIDIDIQNGCARYRNVEIGLSDRRLRILERIHAAKSDFVDRQKIIAHVWGGANISETVFDQALRPLRDKLAKHGLVIENRTNVGYRLRAKQEGPAQIGKDSARKNDQHSVAEGAVSGDLDCDLSEQDPEAHEKFHAYPQVGDEETLIPRLTEYDPKDYAASSRLWEKMTSTDLHNALRDKEWAWAAEWFGGGKSVSEIALHYDESGPRYDEQLDSVAQKALREWCENSPSAGRLQKEPWGWQVRLVGAGFSHASYTYDITLAPTKFLYYAAIQQNLWRHEQRALRRYALKNALRGIDSNENLILPSTFSVHMAVISCDGKALLRRRRNDTPLYPLAWEAGVGEFMHGPTREGYTHFTERGQPSLPKFLRDAIEEELNYANAKTGDFRVYGIAAEYRTLAPKLIVVYTSDASIETLMQGALRSKDRSENVRAVDLSVDGITGAFRNKQYPSWGPTSKLALLLALIQHSTDDHKSVVQQVKKKMEAI